MLYNTTSMENIKIINNIIIFFFLILSSIFITHTYYFDHYALGNALIQNNDGIYTDKTNLFFLVNNNSPSLLFDIINFFLKIGFSENFINNLLTFIATLLNLSGIFLISRFITSSIFLSILIALTTIILKKNFGNIDYPTLMFTEHTNGLIAYSLSTFILGLLTIRNLLFAIIFCVFLLSVHLVIGLWMFGLIVFSYFLILKKINVKKIFLTILILLFVGLFYFNSFTNYSEIPYEFNQKDYDDYFYYIEAHRNNMGKLKYIHYDYILKSLILLILIFLYLRVNSSDSSNNNNIFLKTLSISIIASGIIYLSYKIFPQIFPEITIRTIPQRFFLIHSIIGYPIIVSIIYRFFKKLFIKRKINKNYSLILVSTILILHNIQQHDILESRFKNIYFIKTDKVKEELFWKKFNSFNINDYILTSNYLCNKTIIYSRSPILFCFEGLDYIPYLPKLASPSQKITKEILGISYSDVKFKNLGGISEIEVKEAYENKKQKEWKNIKTKFNVGVVIVPKEWNLDIENLILDSKYKVYKIK